MTIRSLVDTEFLFFGLMVLNLDELNTGVIEQPLADFRYKKTSYKRGF